MSATIANHRDEVNKVISELFRVIRQRETKLVNLLYLNSVTPKEIAKTLNCSVQAVYRQYPIPKKKEVKDREKYRT